MKNSLANQHFLSEHQWQIAHAIAQQLVLDDTDVNELKKAMSYLRTMSHRDDAGDRFFKYLEMLASQGHRIGHSKKTTNYYRSLEQLCCQYLQGDRKDSQALLRILGWTFRLMRYYKNGIPPDVLPKIAAATEVMEVQSERQAEIAEVIAEQDLSPGTQLAATIAGIKGNKVTYEIFGTIRLTQKEPKKAKLLTEGETVQVKITALKEDGKIKKIEILD
ncbi:MAG: hypothetical protein JWS08_01470 [Phormidium sp. PBR-2020]|nr:MAG: hypothetical protein JWS08_01470 [Phormidium sp. PBR-2020]